ncbi:MULTISPECIES: replication protein P [Escherichia]|uniref:Phage replication protein n=1 Tax=Escherichia coli TaxID=562 RepID=A0A2A2C452_ECOLX|nr:MULTISPECIES: replication protein P [Escherichia]EEZ9823892.1 phage replication protein [Escherichia coli O91]EFW7477349.1 phage replication protein [Shigella sonnei]ELP2872757.1 phage replication protein [Escherichia coli O8]DAZ28826.1 MAG TPA: replication protein P [Caudoviricetes sp.]HAI0959444.1 phage replication protein [Escherichia coli O25b:H4-ST131]HAX0017168.1 phage replication protein [Escherichia coli JJ2657]
MKNIAAQMINFDREQMRRIANNMPEQYDEKPQVQQVAQIINGVFSQLLATFPASLANRDQNELNEIRRQWVMAFRENGITTMEQVNAGMRVARRQERPFLPSPGQFVAWCKQSGGALGITVDQVITEYWDWRNRSFEFTSSEHFPWSQPVMYHICVELRHRSIERQLTHGELACEAGDLLDMWEKRVSEGKPIPPVRKQISAPRHVPGPTPAQLLLEQYKARKAVGFI